MRGVYTLQSHSNARLVRAVQTEEFVSKPVLNPVVNVTLGLVACWVADDLTRGEALFLC